MPPDSIAVGKGYALWLTPEEPVFGRLSRDISRLSRELSTPRFEPHLTLLSRIRLPEENALAKSALLAGMLKPTRILLGDIEHLDDYFRCIFVGVIPGESIIKARRTACRVFGRPTSAYVPHLSFVYGSLPADIRKRLAADLKSLEGQSLDLRSFTLYRVAGAPREWKCIRRFNLK